MKKVAIPEKMQKFYGTGTMLHPDKEMIKEIPAGQVTTIDALCRKLAYDHNTDVTCPMRTNNFIKAVTETYSDGSRSIPFWRVIRKNHQLINSHSTELCAENLKKEGFQVNENNKGEFEGLNVEKRLFTFL
ncbi:MAG: hypothetical protein ACFB2Y_04460 [Fulvivirga sp.]